MLQTRMLSDEAIDQLVAAVAEWLKQDLAIDRRLQAHATEQKALDQKAANLTDALIRGLIDRTLFCTQKEALQLQNLTAEKEKRHLAAGAPERIRAFVEVVNTLVSLYRSLHGQENRSFLKSVTSKRLVLGKN